MEQPEYIRLNEILVAPKAVAAPVPDPTAPSHRCSCPARPLLPRAVAATDDPAALSIAEAKANDLSKQTPSTALRSKILRRNTSEGPSAADGGALGTFKRGTARQGTRRTRPLP